jgi:hypothetical protein
MRDKYRHISTTVAEAATILPVTVVHPRNSVVIKGLHGKCDIVFLGKYKLNVQLKKLWRIFSSSFNQF